MLGVNHYMKMCIRDSYSVAAKKQISELEKFNLDKLPICIDVYKRQIYNKSCRWEQRKRKGLPKWRNWQTHRT